MSYHQPILKFNCFVRLQSVLSGEKKFCLKWKIVNDAFNFHENTYLHRSSTLSKRLINTLQYRKCIKTSFQLPIWYEDNGSRKINSSLLYTVSKLISRFLTQKKTNCKTRSFCYSWCNKLNRIESMVRVLESSVNRYTSSLVPCRNIHHVNILFLHTTKHWFLIICDSIYNFTYIYLKLQFLCDMLLQSTGTRFPYHMHKPCNFLMSICILARYLSNSQQINFHDWY
jgi:hypothetical protein